jgi:hypothetical protein
MTIGNLVSREQVTAIKDLFAAAQITAADFNGIEIIGDLIRHIEIVDNEKRQHETQGGTAYKIERSSSAGRLTSFSMSLMR